MRYTYDISFNGSDYVDFTPSNSPKFTVESDQGQFRYRETCDEFKISKHLNSTIYATLETWFTDDTKYFTEIKIRVKKGNDVKYKFITSIKQINLNQENGYIVIFLVFLTIFATHLDGYLKSSTDNNKGYFMSIFIIAIIMIVFFRILLWNI